jgi:Flp pilus assembly pilin Flp
MLNLLFALSTDRRGATAIEYGLIVASVGLAAAGLMGSLGESLLSIFGKILAAFDAAKGG